MNSIFSMLEELNWTVWVAITILMYSYLSCMQILQDEFLVISLIQ